MGQGFVTNLFLKGKITMTFYRTSLFCIILSCVSAALAQNSDITADTLTAAKYDEQTIKEDMAFFTDTTCSKLKPGFTKSDLNKIKSPLIKNIAEKMLKGTYDLTYRCAEYKAYATPKTLSKTLKLGRGFSRYENITGIYLQSGSNVVFVGNTAGKKIALLIPEFTRKPPKGIEPTKDPKGWGLYKQTIKLEEGFNHINVEKPGNAYISYFDDDPENAPTVKVHFATGMVNGYFDITKNSDQDWNRLLDNAVSPIMDARGKFIQVAYPVKWLKEFAYGKGRELIGNYDKLLWYQYELMGLVKYNKLPKNRILARVNYNYYMFRDGDGVAYLGNRSTMRMVTDPKVVIKGDPCWGFSHEVGHVLQMIPQMTWAGMTEVSNNMKKHH